ncbi:MAG: threonine synthase [Caldilinea sp.]|uniref:threonine synthase n=1 Tax=Caldilinea sp. TaxID=2293560 RepID=UPI002C46E818|nr:threonine synthase [Anaerolineales bacterium]HQY90607.1 threonine synthase [Caldilinea sp.]
MTGIPLEFTDMPLFDPASIEPNTAGLWRYAAMLPVLRNGARRVTLGEGWTPLIAEQWAGRDVYWKLDALMPTGSYKDRGVSVMVNWLKGLGYESLADDSSGNAGASLACYASRAGLRACIFVPATAPNPKKAQIAIYGAELVEVPGARSEATRAVEVATWNSREMAYASHAWHPAFLLGQMTVAWEIWEQLGGAVPDWLIAPAGHGGTLLGAWRGFQHLRVSGVINRLPRLLAVQAEPYTPLYDAFVAGADAVEPTPHVERISANGIAISYPVRWRSLLDAIRFSKGMMLAVAESEVVQAYEELAGQGIFVEPTSATIAAALKKIPEKTFRPTDLVVGILTGHGLKDPPKI